MNRTQLKMKLEKMEKADKLGLWLSALMFIVSVLFQGFHKDIGFWIAGGIGIVVSFLMFVKSIIINKIEKAGLWLTMAMFSASVLFQGFHYDLGFLIAGIIGILFLCVLFCLWRKNKII